MAFTHQSLSLSVKLSVSAILLVVVFSMVDTQDFWLQIRQLQWWVVPLAWCFYAFCQWLSAIRWQWLLQAKQIQVPVYKLFEFYMVGMFFNNFLPGAVGGDLIKGYDLYQHTKRADEAIVSVFMERFTGLMGLTLLALMALGLMAHRIESISVIILVGGSSLLLVLLCVGLWLTPSAPKLTQKLASRFPQQSGQLLEDAVRSLVAYKQHPKTIFKTVILSLFIQSLFALYYALAAVALGMQISVLYFVLFLPLITLVTMLPISFGGLGLREVTMVSLFALVGISSAQVLAVSLSVHVVNLGLSLFGGLIWVLRKPGHQILDPVSHKDNH